MSKPVSLRLVCALLIMGSALLSPLYAVEPDERLPDPAQEMRARSLSAGLRCLVCQNQSIDDSNAPLARDLRVLLRERIAAGDRDSARQMQIASKDWTPKVLAFFITFGFFGALVWILVFGIPKTGMEVILMMLGSLSTAWTGVIQFYFGSSAGSKEKNNLLAAKDK